MESSLTDKWNNCISYGGRNTFSAKDQIGKKFQLSWKKPFRWEFIEINFNRILIFNPFFQFHSILLRHLGLCHHHYHHNKMWEIIQRIELICSAKPFFCICGHEAFLFDHSSLALVNWIITLSSVNSQASKAHSNE